MKRDLTNTQTRRLLKKLLTTRDRDEYDMIASVLGFTNLTADEIIEIGRKNKIKT